jgi:hypothetical protein
MSTIVTRAGKAAPLTNAEVDANFTNLNTDKFEAPSQTGNSGKFLTTNGTAASWANVPAPNNGTLTLGVSGTGLSGSASFTADQAGNSTFTVTSNATSANTNGAIVARDGSGNFSAGTITAALNGNAGTATILQTTRSIGGVNFNGSANIDLPGVNVPGNQNTTGSAATLTTTRTLWGQNFNGSANVTGALSSVTTISMSGQLTNTVTTGTAPFVVSSTTRVSNLNVATAGTADTLTTARTINGTSFNGSANITITAANPSALTLGTGLTGSSYNGSAAVTATVSYGTTAGTACQGNDSRLSDARQATNTNTQLASLGVGTAASGTAGEIRATGNITAGFSDDRLKNKLGTIEGALHKVRALTGFYYEANETAQAIGLAGGRDVGLSAQAVKAVQPEATAPAPVDEQYLTVRYERLVPLLVEAIKELDGELQFLKAQLKG